MGSLGNADAQFARAFGDVQRIQNIRQRAGPFQVLVPLKKFWEGLKVMDAFIEPFVQDALNHSPEELDEKETKSSSGSTWLQSVARFTRDRKGSAKYLSGRCATADGKRTQSSGIKS